MLAADTATAHQYKQNPADGTTYPRFYPTQAIHHLGQDGFGNETVLSATLNDNNSNNDVAGTADRLPAGAPIQRGLTAGRPAGCHILKDSCASYRVFWDPRV